MRALIFISTLLQSLWSIEYISKIMPYESYKVASTLSGEVIYVDDLLEYSYVKESKLIVEIDSKSDKIELQSLQKEIKLKKKLEKIREAQFRAKEQIDRLSEYEKLNEELNYISQKRDIISTQKEIDLLKERIDRKYIRASDRYIGEIFAKKDEFVNAGEPLFESFDISKLAIELFVREKDIENIYQKKIYIDGKLSKFRVEKVSKIKDNENISTYYVKIIKPNQDRDYRFSKIVKVEFKE